MPDNLTAYELFNGCRDSPSQTQAFVADVDF